MVNDNGEYEYKARPVELYFEVNLLTSNWWLLDE